jgi:hypothetical protein
MMKKKKTQKPKTNTYKKPDPLNNSPKEGINVTLKDSPYYTPREK